MKNKGLFGILAVAIIVTLAGVTVFGASEISNFGYNSRFMNRNGYDNRYSSYGNEDFDVSFETAKIVGNVQEITTELSSYSFPAIVVQKDIPVKWTITADEYNLNYCNNEIVIDSLNIVKPIKVGTNVIEFTPTENGAIPYSCYMGMINSAILVVDDINNYDKEELEAQLLSIPQVDCCSGGRRGRF